MGFWGDIRCSSELPTSDDNSSRVSEQNHWTSTCKKEGGTEQGLQCNKKRKTESDTDMRMRWDIKRPTFPPSTDLSERVRVAVYMSQCNLGEHK